MKHTAILSGRNLFRQAARIGKRLDGRYFRCIYVLVRGGEGVVQTIFKVPSRKISAVRRNRIRRLMRAALRAERAELDASLARSSSSLGLIVTFTGANGVAPERLSLMHVRKDMSQFCRAIAAKVSV